MKIRLSLLMLVLLAVPAARLAVGAAGATPALDQEFVTPPREARPLTYWMWLGTVAPPECITRDLEEFYAKGIVGVLIYPSSLGPVWYPEHKVVLEGKQYRKVETAEYGGKSAPTPFDRMASWSDEWRASVRFAAKEANRIGIDLGVAIGTTAPREFVSNEFGQQELKWSEATFKGPGLFEGDFAGSRDQAKQDRQKATVWRTVSSGHRRLGFPGQTCVEERRRHRPYRKNGCWRESALGCAGGQLDHHAFRPGGLAVRQREKPAH